MKLKQTAKLYIALLALAAAVLILAGSAQASGTEWTQRQKIANQIADLGRSIGLADDDPIIAGAKKLWNEDAGKEQDIKILATVIYNEAGNGCTEEHQLLVGRVLLNRVEDGRFGGSTVRDVVSAPKQYLPAYANGDSRYAVPADRAIEFESLARRALLGEPKDCPTNVLYQDNLKHGTGVYKSFYSTLLGSTTYFCFG